MTKLQITLEHEGHSEVQGFWIVWLRHVMAFNPQHHCMKCLLGHNDKRFRKYMPLGSYVIETAAPWVYLCGVSTEFRWLNNLHVPIRPTGKDKDRFSVQAYTGMGVHVIGGETAEIPALPDGWSGHNKKYTTCRNFQFAVEYFGYPGEVSIPPKQLNLGL